MVRRCCLLFSLFVSVPLLAQGTAMRPGDATSVGCDAKGLQAATQLIADVVRADEVLGAVVLVARGRTIVLHEAFGWRDAAGEQVMQKDTLFRMASNTKAVTAAAVLALVDDGKIALDDAIMKWLPSFADGDAAKITVRHLLTHTSGLRINSLFLRPLMAKSVEHPTAPNLVLEALRFGAVGPKVEPGTTYSYSNPGYNTLAALVEVVSGQGFEPFCKQRFYDPLGMRDTCNHETRADNARMSAVVRLDGSGDWRERWRPGGKPTVPFVRGSGGLISTATDFAQFCRCWLDGGRFGERRLLSADSVRAATRSQTGHIDKVSYGFGWRIDDGSVFAHGGSDGTFAWCDPQRDLIGLVFTQTQGGQALGKMRRRFRELVTAACPPR